MFSVPKAFRGNTRIIQCNAIRSWLILNPKPEIILFGDEDGTKEVARELGVEHVPTVRCNSYGTPLVNDVFSQAEKFSNHKLLCYINTDIVLMSEFMTAVRIVSKIRQYVVMIGECWDLGIGGPLRFDTGNWEANLRTLLRSQGSLRGPFFIDYLVFTRGMYANLPPFAIGRARYDNWLVWEASRIGARVVDVTRFVQPVHQCHDYSHVPGGRMWSYRGTEAKQNQKLAGLRRYLYLYSILNATDSLEGFEIREKATKFLLMKQLWLRSRMFIGEYFPARNRVDQS